MVDYSKWKDIEISDDEDDTHPNIDTPSLFRWRHTARLERMEQMEHEKQEVETQKQTIVSKLEELKAKISNGEGDLEEIKAKFKELETQGRKLEEKQLDLNNKEKKSPWNVDTISKPGFEKTVINKKAIKRSDDELTEEEKQKRLAEFIKQNEKLMKQYGMLRKYDDSKRFLLDHHHLVCDDTANYLVIWCINLEMEKKHDLMSHVAHQCICMQYILEMAKQLDIDPRACVGSFFKRIEENKKGELEKDLHDFKKRIEKRAEEKLQEAIAEQEEEERKQRLGPGGLDPVEVFESLPEELQKCFESRDIQLLQEAIAKIPPEEAKYHMKRCIDSGLWVPDAKNANNEGDGDGDSGNVEDENAGNFMAEKDEKCELVENTEKAKNTELSENDQKSDTDAKTK